ncbi:MAG: methionyl-tRNA formyltransferase [Methanoregulaceae archaeon]|nr:methionyl-tRNA formyltransferase [Methanoregulaceae archaeon]
MRLVYFGTASFAVPALRVLADHVVLAVSQPDRPSGRGMRMHPSPVKQAALELGVPCETPERSRAPEFIETLRGFEADALVVAAYGQILSLDVLTSAKRGGINLHGSILPAYRGAAPIQRCLINGDAETGVTLMQMDRGMDTGDMIDIVRTAIDPDETYGELQERLAIFAADLARDWMPRIVAGDYPRTPQDSALATMAPKLERIEGQLRTAMPAAEAYNRFRGVTPSPGAFFESDYGRVKIVAARIGVREGVPGAYLGGDELAFAGGSLRLAEVQPEGRGRMSLSALANGLRLRPGDALVSS